MRNERSYKNVFSDRLPIEAWPIIVAVLKAAEEVLLSSPRKHGPLGEKFLRSWRGIAALLFVSKSAGTFGYNERDILRVEINEASRPLVSECWEFVHARRKEAMRPNEVLVRQICSDFADEHSLAGMDFINRHSMPRVLHSERSIAVPATPPTQEFLAQVDALLPRQPWPNWVANLSRLSTQLRILSGLASAMSRPMEFCSTKTEMK
jgi:hypothetical protein